MTMKNIISHSNPVGHIRILYSSSHTFFKYFCSLMGIKTHLFNVHSSNNAAEENDNKSLHEVSHKGQYSRLEFSGLPST